MPRPRTATAKRPAPRKAATATSCKTFYATLHVTRVEEWCVEAADAGAARALLAAGAGERRRIGDCLHLEIEELSD
jgi:hypothetical protein